MNRRQQKACLDLKGEGKWAPIGGPHVIPATRQAVEGAVRGPQLHLRDGVARVADAKHEPGCQV